MRYKNLDKLQPNFRKKVEAFIKEATPLGVFITETWRSDEQQYADYKAGASRIDGKTKKSNHQLGLAIDIAFNGAELYPSDINIWNKTKNIAKKYGIKWGGDWTSFIDKPHFEDDGTIFKDTACIYNSKDAIKFCLDEGIFRDDQDLQRILSPQDIESILFNAHLISLNKMKGLTKERWALFIHKLLTK